MSPAAVGLRLAELSQLYRLGRWLAGARLASPPAAPEKAPLVSAPGTDGEG